MLFNASLQYTIYLGLSYASFIAATQPQARVGMFLIIVGWLGYIIADTYKDYASQKQLNKKGMTRALAGNIAQFLFLFLAVVIGLWLGFN